MNIDSQNKSSSLLKGKSKRNENIFINIYKALIRKKSNSQKLNSIVQANEEELKATNDELYEKNEIINNQNIELKLALQNLKEAQSQLIHAEKMASLGVLTAGVAHEINNPLNYIKSAYYGLEEYFDEHGSKDKDLSSILLEGIKNGVEKAAGIVRGLNEFSRQNNTLDEECKIHSILDNCLLMLQNQYMHKIQIQKKYNKEPIIIKGNVGQLHQVFINIIVNAIQSIENNGQINISTKKDNDYYIIEINDSGCGINSEILPKITDPFFTTKAPGKGTGLGLSITNKIIKTLMGKLEFESKLNEGTIVRVFLPN